MQNSMLDKIKKCYRYRDLNTAIFLLQSVYKDRADYLLMMGIVLYENREFKRCISYIKGLNTTTAHYYRALAHKQLKNYSDAIECIEQISLANCSNDTTDDPWISNFILNKEDSEFFDSLLGELSILRGKAKSAIDKFRRVMFKNPLLLAADSIFNENMKIEPIEVHKDDLVMKYFLTLHLLNSKIADSNSLKSVIGFYKTCIPGQGSYYLSKIATILFKHDDFQQSQALFEFLREKDPYFINEMETYSSLLWRCKNKNALGLLAKDLCESHPHNYVTWTVAGNYYSINGQFKESSHCFTRSLSIQENPHAYTLLGFECNSKSQYLEAQTYFKSSLCMLEHNEKALFGLGVSYAETFKKDRAEQCFKRAISINPFSLNMKAYLIRFLVKNGSFDEGFKKIKEFLSIKANEIDEIVSFVEMKSGEFSELEELMLCEFAEILARKGHKSLATRLLQCVECRTTSYYSKKALIETTE